MNVVKIILKIPDRQ